MKKNKKITLTILAIIMSLAITTCSGNSAGGGARIGSSAGNSAGGGTGGNGVDVTITLPSFRAAGASWSVPSGDRPFVSYTITLSGPSTASKTVSLDEPSATFTVLAGDYNISIQAVYSKSGSPVAKGSTSVEVKAGKKNTATINLGPVYNAGDRGPGGGWVYYIADGWNGRQFGFTMADTGEKCFYLEFAEQDLVGGGSVLAWVGLGVTPVTLGTQAGIGAGRMNTQLILDKAKTLGTNSYPAAEACTGDWFLPSINELDAIFSFIKNSPGGLNDAKNVYKFNFNASGGSYWSSTEYSNSNAMFIGGGITGVNIFVDPANNDFKANSKFVRPIRAF